MIQKIVISGISLLLSAVIATCYLVLCGMPYLALWLFISAFIFIGCVTIYIGCASHRVLYPKKSRSEVEKYLRQCQELKAKGYTEAGIHEALCNSDGEIFKSSVVISQKNDFCVLLKKLGLEAKEEDMFLSTDFSFVWKDYFFSIVSQKFGYNRKRREIEKLTKRKATLRLIPNSLGAESYCLRIENGQDGISYKTISKGGNEEILLVTLPEGCGWEVVEKTIRTLNRTESYQDLYLSSLN